VLAGGAFALGLLGAIASSDAIGIRIELDAPSDCATAEAFYEKVRSRTERVRPVVEGEAGVRVVVRITRLGAKTHGELRVIGESGESDTRRVDGSSCTEVVEALSLTVALAVDPTARLAPPAHVENTNTNANASTPSTGAPPSRLAAVEGESPVAEPEPPEPEPAVERELETRVGAEMLAMNQVTPFVSFGGGGSLRFVMPWRAATSFGVAVVHLQNDLLSSAENASVRSTLVELSVCPKRFLDPTVFTLEPCITGLGGTLAASGRDVAHSSDVSRSYFALGAKLVGAFALGKGWAVEVQAGLAVPLTRRRFVVLEPRRQVGETPSISALGGVGVAYAF
jgi:hypothetical protein